MSSDRVIEKFGIYFDEIGLNKTCGRMFGLFMTITEPTSMGQLVAKLKISKSTASTEIRRLLKMGYIEKVLIPEQRADYYQLKKGIWVTHLLQKREMIKQLYAIVDEIPAKELSKNLKEMGDYCSFMKVEFKSLADKYIESVKQEVSGFYIERGKQDQKFIVKWDKLLALSEEYHKKMLELAELGIATFREIEIEFLKAYPKALEEDQSLAGFFGLHDLELEKAMNAKLEKIFCTHPNQLSSQWQSAMKDVYYYVATIREENSEKILGFATFMSGGFIPENEFKITGVAVDHSMRRRGVASLLINSLDKIGIKPKKLFASTRPSNKSAISAYEKWGFREDAEAAKSSPAHFISGHWVHLARYE